MKIAGKTPSKNEDVVVFKRTDGDIIFKLTPVQNFDAFIAACPTPEVPKQLLPGKGQVGMPNDPAYKAAVAHVNVQLMNYIILESVKNTPDLEWETVKMDDPTTWGNWETELREAHFLSPELEYLLQKVLQVNALDDSKLEEARDSFLAEQQARSS